MTHSRRTFIVRTALSAASVTGGTILTSLLTKCNREKSSKKIKLLSVNGDVVEADENSVNRIVPKSVHDLKKGVPGKRFVMVFDLSKCNGEGKCLSACSKMHYLPPQKSYLRLSKMKRADLSSPYWQPATCNHCDKPPCVKVCPVGATFKLSDGIVAIDNTRCIGCRFCIAACPYGARTFNWSVEDYTLTDEQFKQIAPHEICSDHKLGTVEKCDFCPHNSMKGLLPACVTGCPHGVIYFGDENEDSVSNGVETVRLSAFLKENDGYRLREELGTHPRVYYLPVKDRIFPFENRVVDRSDYL